MRYLKLYEAFKSEILSKTLSFLNTDSKDQIVQILEKICEIIDFPISELSDEFFQRLNFKNALELFVDENHPKNKVKWIKFWFDRNGKFIDTTCVDGSIKNSNLDDYEIVKGLRLDEITELQTGDIVYIQISYGYDPVIATVFRAEDEYGIERVYMIQNQHSGSEPEYQFSRDWMKYGNCSWVVTSSGDFLGTPKLLKKDTEREIDAYSYNFDFVLDTRGSTIKIRKGRSFKDILKPATFALVLDVEALTSKDYTKKSNIKSGRVKSRENSLALMTDELVKTQNVERYFQEISNKIKFDPDLANIKTLMIKILGGKKLLINVLIGNLADLNNLILDVYSFIKEEKIEEDDYKNIIYRIERDVRKSFLDNGRENQKRDIYILGAKKLLNKQSDNKSKLILELIGSYEKMLLDFYNEINQKEINTLQEAEVICYKLYAIAKLMDSYSSRFKFLRRIFNILILLNTDSIYNVFIEESEKSLEENNKSIAEFSDTIIKIIK